jgi:hypothetical protein
MNNFFVRLFVACACFVLSISLTNLTKLVRGSVDVSPPSAETTRSFLYDEIQIREISRQYGPAQTRHDRAFFERIETEDFRLFYENTSLSRDEDIRWMESAPTDIVYHNQPHEISIFGNSAVVRGTFEVRSGEYVQRWSTIDVWVRRGDQWQIRSTTSGY